MLRKIWLHEEGYQ